MRLGDTILSVNGHYDVPKRSLFAAESADATSVLQGQITQWILTQRVVRIVLETYTKDINHLVKSGELLAESARELVPDFRVPASVASLRPESAEEQLDGDTSSTRTAPDESARGRRYASRMARARGANRARATEAVEMSEAVEMGEAAEMGDSPGGEARAAHGEDTEQIAPPSASSPPPAGSAAHEPQMQQLQELWEAGVLTDDELAEKQAALSTRNADQQAAALQRAYEAGLFTEEEFLQKRAALGARAGSAARLAAAQQPAFMRTLSPRSAAASQVAWKGADAQEEIVTI